jgi:lipopolysaccharide/colanic/teichoic acid biosynthesis glycosyltransferase
MKRIFDFIVSAAGLIILSPLFLLVALLIKLDSAGPILFTQRRIGRQFRPFLIYKFRTMRVGAEAAASLTVGADPRITRLGKYLRASKIDELPQLFNVLQGDMSLVGPRPELPRYVELFRRDYEDILKVKPGLTDLASLKYSDEASILGESPNPEQDYLTRVLPDKIHLAKEYIELSSFWYDLKLVLGTIFKLFGYQPIRTNSAARNNVQ